MTEGTKSYLIGCHQFLLHPLWVLLAWRLEYKSWPRWWELICIILHDCGVCGRQYLSDDEAKIGHWEKGAILSQKIIFWCFPIKYASRFIDAFYLCAGHCPGESGYMESKLSRADKRSKLIEPKWWSAFYSLVEPSLRGDPDKWRKLVAENLKREELYLRNRK